MESIEFELGPLAAGLPGGLVLDLSLDSDVVERCEPRATHWFDGAAGDPLAPAASAAALAAAGEPSVGATDRIGGFDGMAGLRGRRIIGGIRFVYQRR
jgi:hypothetical protein